MESNKKKYSVPINEQETHISYMRDETFARIYASDSTSITKFNRLCQKNPEMYQLIEEGTMGNIYQCNDKTLISFRSKKKKVNLSEEQKQASVENLKKYREQKKVLEEE